MLEDVGHTVTIAASVDDLRDAARTDEFNIVMMGLGEARRLRDDVGSWSPDLVVLPVMTYAARPDAARAKREFGQVLTAPALTIELLSTVHDAYAGN